MIAARIANLKKGLNARWKDGPIGLSSPVTIPEAAKRLNVGKSSVKRAKAILKHGSESLIKAVDHGQISAAAPERLARLPKDEQEELVKEGKKAVIRKAKELREREACIPAS